MTMADVYKNPTRNTMRAAWAGTALLCCGALLVAVYDSSRGATLRAEARLQTKIAGVLARAKSLEADAARADKMARKYAAAEAAAGSQAADPFVKMGSKNGQALYDVPSFTEMHTRMHFPQAEASWLDMAAAGKIGDDVKTDEEQGNLTAIIDEWREKAYAEKKQAREDMAIAAKEENYDEYNITTGVAMHKFYNDENHRTSAKKREGGGTVLGGGQAAPTLAVATEAPVLHLEDVQPFKKAAVVDAGYDLQADLRAAALARYAAQHPKTHANAVKTHHLALPARVRREEEKMKNALARVVTADKRAEEVEAKLQSSLHLADVKLARQEMGRAGPSADMDVARTQALTSFGVGPEGDDLTAIDKAEVVDTPFGSIGENPAPGDSVIDEANEAIASQRADGYTNGQGAVVEDISPEDPTA